MPRGRKKAETLPAAPKSTATKKPKPYKRQLTASDRGNEVKERFAVIAEKYHRYNIDDSNLTEEEREEALLLQREALDEATQLMQGFVVSLINSRYPTYKAQHCEDMFQAGCIGIIKGTAVYDPTYGTCPTTLLQRYILHEIQEYLNQNVLGISSHYSGLIRQTLKAQRRHNKGDGEELTILQLAALTDQRPESIKKALDMQAARANQVHLDSAEGLIDTLESKNLEGDPERTYIENEVTRILIDEVKKLPTLEQDCIVLSFGLDNDGKHMANKDIAKELTKRYGRNVSIDTVKRALNSALRRLRVSNLRYAVTGDADLHDRIATRGELPILPPTQDSDETLLQIIVDF